MGNNKIENLQAKIEVYYDEFVEKQKKTGINQRHYSILGKLLASGLKSNHNVLEIGCGIGTFTSLLVKEVVKGDIIAMDISDLSIRYAKEKYQAKNLKFIYADVTKYDFNAEHKFDCIVLPDVLEHIPIELHNNLFKRISSLLKSDGFIFIHIPNPYFLDWCHANRPELLQVIDQPIYTDVLIENTYPHGLFIHELKTYSIWITDNDYQYVVLKKRGYQNFNNQIEYKPTLFDKVKYKLKLILKKQ